jgi:hypothetical protein
MKTERVPNTGMKTRQLFGYIYIWVIFLSGQIQVLYIRIVILEYV